MPHKLVLPIIYLVLSLISLAILKSIAPELTSNQFIFFILGGVLFLITSKIKFNDLQRFSLLLYIGLCGMLVLTLLIGQITKGSTRWIDVAGLFHVQPSQIAVPITILYLSTKIKSTKLLSVKKLFQALAVIVVPATLILVEPDLGTTLIFLLSLGAATWISPIKTQHLLWIVATGVVAASFAWMMVLKPYQKDRVFSFIDSSNHPEASYNSQQALIAVGSGRTWGRGLGQGVQSHLKFLPERQTDFIFASLAEEVGFVGSTVIVLIYFIVFFHLWLVGYNTSSIPQKQYVFGILVLLLTQTFINIGMNIGLMPITGVTLPFVSYGGSSILSMSIAMGVVQSISNNNPKKSALLIK